MRVWEVWVEGYADNGGRNGAQRIGMAATPTFDEAVLEVYEAVPTDEIMNGFPVYHTEGGYRLYKNEHGIWDRWGCSHYDNEIDARRSFG